MRGSTAAVLAILLAAAGASSCRSTPLDPVRRRAWDRLRERRDAPWASIDAASNRLAMSDLEAWTGVGEDPRSPYRGACFVTTLHDETWGRRRWVIASLESTGKIPDQARIQVWVADDEGALVSHTVFGGGWRHLEYSDVRRGAGPGGLDCLSITSLLFAGEWTQHVSLVDGRPALVRLEEKGRPLRNDYAWPNHTLGPVRAPASVAAVLEELRFGSPVAVLSRLTWIGGFHWDGADAFLLHEDKASADLHRRVKADADVRRQIAALAASTHPWIAEAASNALQEP